MIKSYGNKTTEDIYHGLRYKEARKIPQQLHPIVQRKLDAIRRAKTLTDLNAPPGNRLEPLKDDLKGFYSIRVNDQYRIIFKWLDEDAEEVTITDYH